eukprot:1187786-Prorocentrum_minimum.AAC.3
MFRTDSATPFEEGGGSARDRSRCANQSEKGGEHIPAVQTNRRREGEHIPAVRTNWRREESLFPQSEPIGEGRRAYSRSPNQSEKGREPIREESLFPQSEPIGEGKRAYKGGKPIREESLFRRCEPIGEGRRAYSRSPNQSEKGREPRREEGL